MVHSHQTSLQTRHTPDFYLLVWMTPETSMESNESGVGQEQIRSNFLFCVNESLSKLSCNYVNKSIFPINAKLFVIPRIGLLMLTACALYDALQPERELSIHFNSRFMKFQFGWCFWLCAVSGKLLFLNNTA